ncbi:MAG: MotA/TolQ/ExbB proton channel family protein [Opitutales bacterium]|jgi:biopolymer transport protein ExbB
MRRTAIYILVITTLAAGIASADVVDNLVAKVSADIDAASRGLATQREIITSEKLPLAQTLRHMQQDVVALREKAERAETEADDIVDTKAKLSAELGKETSDLEYQTSILGEYVRSLRDAFNPAERQLYANRLDSFLAEIETASGADSAKPEELAGILETGFTRAENLPGGNRFEGRAVLENGTVAKGRFILVGPVAYFVTADGYEAGIVTDDKGELPALTSTGEDSILAVSTVAKDGSGVLPLDVTLGGATAIRSTRDSFLAHIRKGGIWIYPICAFALAAFLMAIAKATTLFSIKQTPPVAVARCVELLKSEGPQAALHYLADLPGAGAEMLKNGIRSVRQERENVEDGMNEIILELQPKLERLLPFISLTAAVSPLLGLLGTVTGMINTFNLITVFGTGDARGLSSGISEALITTEYGLIVAIPALVLHAILSRYVHGILARMETQALAFVNATEDLRS